MPRPRRRHRPAAPLFVPPEQLEARRHLSAELVRDVNADPAGSFFFESASLNADTVLFIANDNNIHGKEIWRTDGTTAGTRLVNELAPGGSSVGPTDLTASAGRAFFITDNGFGMPAFWVTDGTDAGTVKLQSIPGIQTAGRAIVDVNGTAYFAAATGPGGASALWKSDGTPAGTVQVKAIDTPPGGEPISNLTAAGDTVYFTAADTLGGLELWKSNGTASSTTRVRDLRPGPNGSNPKQLTAVGNTLYFFAAPAGAAREVYMTDGTDAGTVRIHQGVNQEPAPGAMATVNGTLYFVPTSGGLWKTDGTTAGSGLVDLVGSTGAPRHLTSVNGRLFFKTYGEGSTRTQLWAADGAGPRLVFDYGPLPLGDDAMQLLTPGGDGALYFAADDATGAGKELWRSAGTPGTTTRVADLMPGAANGIGPPSRTFVHPLGNGVVFGGEDAVSGRELRHASADGVRLVKELNPTTFGSDPVFLADVNGVAFFSAATTTNPTASLWKSDGTAAGTVLVKADAGATPVGNARQSIAAGGLAFYLASSMELWRSDGTAAGTFVLSSFAPYSSTLLNLTAFKDKLYFIRPTLTGRELWTSDGTVAGTRRFTTLIPNFSLWPVGDSLYLNASGGAAGQELWKTDGTEAGTVLVRDVTPGPGGSTLLQFTDINGTLYFFPDDTAAGLDLWKSDGTEAGTVKVKDIGRAGTGISFTAGAGDRLFFTADDGTNGTELWTSDGTPAGTRMVRDIYPGATGAQPNSSLPYGLVTSNGTVYFTADDGVAGRELWMSNGTFAGTVRVKDIYPGPFGSIPTQIHDRNLVAVNGTVYFVASDAASGYELWQTDGTDAGTFMTRDINPGASHSYLKQLTRVGSSLFFAASNGVLGSEPWRATPPAAVAGRHVLTGGTGAAAGSPISGVVPVLPGRTATAAAVTNGADGITAVAVDIGSLPAGATPTPADFELVTGNGSTWKSVDAAPAISVRRGAGASGADRIVLSLPPGAARNTWLRVTVKATAATGLSKSDVFYLGNLAGNARNGSASPAVDTADLVFTRANVGRTSAAALAASDFNRDGRVDAQDVLTARLNQRRTLPFFNVPTSATVFGAAAVAPPAGRTPRPPRRGFFGEITPAALD